MICSPRLCLIKMKLYVVIRNKSPWINSKHTMKYRIINKSNILRNYMLDLQTTKQIAYATITLINQHY